MAEEGDQDKSEAASSYKLTKARQKGSVARGGDLAFVTGLAAFLVYAWAAGPGLAQAIAQAVRGALITGPALADGQFAVLGVVALLFGAVAKPISQMAGVILAVVLLLEVLQTGIVFSAQPLKPDFSRLNPGKGLAKLFSWRLLIETFKNILKLSIYTAVAYLLVRGTLRAEIGAVVDARSLLALMVRTGVRLLAAFALTGLVFAAIDQVIVRKDFGKRMRMSRREVKREHRDREGDPRLKQRRKQLHAEFVKLSQSLKGLRGADMLVTNPEHVAVALRYDGATMPSPLIVSIGVNRIALRLKRQAFIYGVPIIEDRVLARELLRYGQLGGFVPERSFAAVAALYNARSRACDARV